MRKGWVKRVFKEGLLLLLRLYQDAFSVFFGPCCRFTPSCSAYAYGSIERFGIIAGLWLAIKRLIKCHPLHPGGYDPIPETPSVHSHPAHCLYAGRQGRQAKSEIVVSHLIFSRTAAAKRGNMISWWPIRV